MEKVPKGTRMCAQFTHQSLATSGKSADGATEIYEKRIIAKGSVNAPPQCARTGKASLGTKKR